MPGFLLPDIAFYLCGLKGIRMEQLLLSDTKRFSAGTPVRTAADALSAKFIGLFLHCAVCITGREMAVIQNPNLHPSFPGLIQNHIHIRPPFGAAEIRVRTAFHTDCLDIAFVNNLHILP